MRPEETGIDLEKTTPITCSCGNYTFTASAILRKASALISPNGREGIVPIPVFTCNACGNIPPEIIPKFLKDEAKQKEDGIKQTKLTLEK